MFRRSSLFQYLAAICANILTIVFGTQVGWTSTNLILLKSENTPLVNDGPLNDIQLSWIASMLCFGALLGTLLFGWMSEKFGRKFSLFICAIGQSISGLLIVFGESVLLLYIARFISGIASGGVFILIPLFTTEIAQDDIRGTLGSMLVMCANIGILIGFITGNYLSYYEEAYFNLSLPIIFLLVFIVFPETPIFLIKSKKYQEAEMSLKMYHNVKKSNEKEWYDFQMELNELKLRVQTENNNKINFKDFSTRSARKALIFGITLIALHELSGVFVLVNYTATIFTASGSSLSPYMSAIIVGVIQIIGTYISVVTVDRVGRRFLFIVSCIGSSIFLMILGIYTHLNSLGYQLETFNWIPVTSFSFYLFIASCGVLPLPYVVMAELLPEKIRGSGATICLFFSWSLSAALLKGFSFMNTIIGLYGCIYVFAICTIAGLLFIIYFIPETKGKSFDEILLMLER